MTHLLDTALSILETAVQDGDSGDPYNDFYGMYYAAEQALAKLKQLREAGGWRPIAEAPKDAGVEVLLYRNNEGWGAIEIGVWSERFQVWSTELHSDDAPTHYMLLPSPPTEDL